MKRSVRLIVIFFVFAQFLCFSASGQEIITPTKSGKPSTRGVDSDVPPEAEKQLLPFLTFGARLELEYEFENNYDFDDGANEDVNNVEPELSLAFSFDPSEKFQAFVNLELLQELELKEGNESEYETRLRLTQAYLLFKELLNIRFSFQVGRQRVDDNREWLYDEELDAARVFYEISDFTLELSVSRLNLIRRDLLNDESGERVNNYIIYGSYEFELEEEIKIAVYSIFRDDQSDGRQSPVFFGIHSSGEIINDLEYWLELAHVRGRDGSNKIRGYGFDIGGFYEFDLPLEPTLIFAYAFGTGDDNPDDGFDKNFRQTGLQDNEDKFNGETTFEYYGVLFDPELSNLSIFTAGIGIKPTDKSSVDLVYHYYRQSKASKDLRDVAIDEDPNGISKSLGSEIDLILGYEEIKNVDLELALGYFIPGKAFPESDNAFFVGLEIQYKF